MRDKEAEQAEIVARLSALLDQIDETTRQPGEPSLRQTVAEQARQNLAELVARPAHRTATHDDEGMGR